MTDRISRRQFLKSATGAVVAGVGLSGCLGTDEPLMPEVPADEMKRAGWKHTDTAEEQFDQTMDIGGESRNFGVHAKATFWEHDQPVQDLDVDVPESSDVPGMMFVGGKGRTDPPTGTLLEASDRPLKAIVNEAEPEIRARIQGQERVQNIERVESDTIETVNGEEARRFIYHIDYGYEEFTTTIEGQQVTIQPGTFEVEVQLAIWIHNGLVASGGGAYPAEEATITAAKSGRTRDVTLGFNPDEYRSEIADLITRVD